MSFSDITTTRTLMHSVCKGKRETCTKPTCSNNKNSISLEFCKKCRREYGNLKWGTSKFCCFICGKYGVIELDLTGTCGDCALPS